MAADRRRAEAVAEIAAILHGGGTESPRPSRTMRLLLLESAQALLEDAEALLDGEHDLAPALKAILSRHPAHSFSQLEAALLRHVDDASRSRARAPS